MHTVQQRQPFVERRPLNYLNQTQYNLYLHNMSLVMRKPGFCICENKDANHLRGNRETDQRLCFRYRASTIPPLPKPEISSLAIFCGCTAWFVSDLVGNPEDRFIQNEAHMHKATQKRTSDKKATQNHNRIVYGHHKLYATKSGELLLEMPSFSCYV